MINMSLGSASLDIILFLLLIVSYIKSKKIEINKSLDNSYI